MRLEDGSMAVGADVSATANRLAADRFGRNTGRRAVQIGTRWVGADWPVFVIAEIGINHNGDLGFAKKLIDVAAASGCDAVKFQKRTPELCVPRDQWYERRQTPWGELTYLDYRHRVELDRVAYEEIDRHCRARSILWFASCWDEAAVEFIDSFDPPCYKAASASLTDLHLLRTMKSTDRPLMLSTGMSTMEEIERSVMSAGTEDLLIAHSNSTYPCPVEILNLSVIRTLQARYPYCPIGYSGHESGYAATLAAVALGASFVERHITLDREMWGSDQRASLEPAPLAELVRSIREIEAAMGDGVKRRYPSELAAMRKLRRVAAPALIR
ncbi:MAG TPA: N-acetylneuraminate synthase family protein [Polyangiales bacterium]|nr:N-acetylneuraminate synthase family protein [Polyangiales bacterium]